jgi:outer membrane lipoprotein
MSTLKCLTLFRRLVASGLLCTATACSGPQVIPSELEEQIDSSVSFRDIQASPQSLQGKTVLLGGEVLAAKRVQEGTELERRSESQGRFLALDRTLTDPASLPPGTRLTLVGAVTGEETRRLDESTYRYPTVEAKHMYVWEPDVYRERSRRPVGLFGGVGFGFGSGGRSGSFGGVGIGTGF